MQTFGDPSIPSSFLIYFVTMLFLLSGHRESCTHFPAQRRIGSGPISTPCSQQRCKRNLQTSTKARCPDTSVNERTAGKHQEAFRGSGVATRRAQASVSSSTLKFDKGHWSKLSSPSNSWFNLLFLLRMVIGGIPFFSRSFQLSCVIKWT